METRGVGKVRASVTGPEETLGGEERGGGGEGGGGGGRRPRRDNAMVCEQKEKGSSVCILSLCGRANCRDGGGSGKSFCSKSMISKNRVFLMHYSNITD